MQKNNTKVLNAWCLYDWANSVYALVISSTLFPVYYNNVTRQAFGGEEVSFFDFRIANTVIYSYSISVGYLILVLILPLLSGMADYSGKKKTFMQVFTWIGGLSCMSLFFFTGKNIEFGILIATLAVLGYAGSLVFYNSFLSDIATKERHDYLSAKGYAWGYIGSVILLVLILPLVILHKNFGFTNELEAMKYGFLITGIWWIGFAQVTFYFLPNAKEGKTSQNLFSQGYKEIYKVYQMVKKMSMLKAYLFSFFFYIMGVQTVMFLAATFGEKEIKLSSDKLIITVLLIQLLAIVGAYFFAWISVKKGNRFSILLMLLAWIGACIGAYFIQNEYHFYLLAILIGLIMGGIQSLSRSTYSKLIPKDSPDSTSFFSFYDVTEKIAIVLGTFVYGMVEHISGSMRNSTIALTIFFIIGFSIMIMNKLEAQD
ncbi:MAG: MFS transporter [Thermoflexibacter sp.]|jgi:UMF1 family MFS transporter|nr:MFS transporter [Thermoflexibacter sp.]